MGLAINYLRILGALTVALGFVYLVAPLAMTDPTGFGVIGAGGLTDVRATYGGFQIGVGAFTLWAAADPTRVRAALTLTAMTIASIGLSRLTGLMLDDSFNSFHAAGLATETTLTVFTLYVLRGLGQEVS